MEEKLYKCFSPLFKIRDSDPIKIFHLKNMSNFLTVTLRDVRSYSKIELT